MTSPETAAAAADPSAPPIKPLARSPIRCLYPFLTVNAIMYNLTEKESPSDFIVRSQAHHMHTNHISRRRERPWQRVEREDALASSSLQKILWRCPTFAAAPPLLKMRW